MLSRNLFYTHLIILIYLGHQTKKLACQLTSVVLLLLNLRLRISFKDIVPSGTKGSDPWFSPWAIRIALGFA